MHKTHCFYRHLPSEVLVTQSHRTRKCSHLIKTESKILQQFYNISPGLTTPLQFSAMHFGTMLANTFSAINTYVNIGKMNNFEHQISKHANTIP